MTRVLSALLLLIAGGTVARATDVPVTGLKLIIVDKLASASVAKTIFVAKDTAITKGSGVETPLFSELGIAYDGNSGVFAMLPAGWIVNKEAVAKYVNKTAPTGGSVKVSVIKPSNLIKMAAKSLGDTPLDISTAPTGSVFVTHVVLNDVDTIRHCTKFGTCVHKAIAGGTGYKLVCKGDSTGDPTCAGAPPVACCSTAAPALCGWLDPLLCEASGGTPGGSNSVCDSVTGTCIGSASAGGCCEGFPSAFGDICLAGPDAAASCPGTFFPSGICSPDGSCS